jgi:hypothetical protein
MQPTGFTSFAPVIGANSSPFSAERRPPMTSREMYRTRSQNATPTLRRWTLVAFAAGFLLLYLTADFVVANLAS